MNLDIARQPDRKKEREELEQQKTIEYFAAAYAAWYATRLEYDKGLLTLSAGGIGLMITLVTTVGVFSAFALCLYALAIFSFSICIGLVLYIFNKNSQHIVDVLLSNDQVVDEKLVWLDKFAGWSFGIGIFFSLILGVTTGCHSYATNLTKEKELAENNQKAGHSVTTFANDSVNGMSAFKPVDMGKSFSGMSSMKPSPAQTATPAAQQQVVVPVANKK